MGLLVGSILMLVTESKPAELYAQAVADYSSLPPEVQPAVRYLSVPDTHASLVRFMVASFSRVPHVDAVAPIPIAPGLVRIDLEALGWTSGWETLMSDYPYSIHKDRALVVRFDWMMDKIVDQTRSDAGMLLLWGEVPKTTADLERLVGLDRKENKRLALQIGHIEGSSGVARQPERIIELNQLLGGWYAQTYDFETLNQNNSPVDRLDLDDPNHDASEIIIGLRKYWRGGSGLLQAYALADGKGTIQVEAPIELVEDSTRVGGYPTVRNSISCISCHNVGLLNFSENRLESLLEAGVELYGKDQRGYDIEQQFLSNFDRDLERAQEDYQAAQKYLTGLDPSDFAKAYVDAVNDYRKPVAAERVAEELGLTFDELRDRLAIYSEQYALPGNLAALAHGEPLTREYFEDSYIRLKEIVK